MKKLRTYLSLILAVLLSQILSVTAIFAAGEVTIELNTSTKKIIVPYSSTDQIINNEEIKLGLKTSASYPNQPNIKAGNVSVTTNYRVGNEEGTIPSSPFSFDNISQSHNVPIAITVPAKTPVGIYRVKVKTTISNTTNASENQKIYDDVIDYVVVEVVALPTATVQYSTTSPTNQSVVATLVNESRPITIKNNGGLKSYTFTENGSFTFEFVDNAGIQGTAVATVTNIDKTNPTATVSYNTTDPTNQNVIATLTPSEPITVTNNSGLLSYTFTENGSFIFEFKDAAGNTGSAKATISNIDREQPTATISYSKTGPTNENVVATMTPSKPVTVTNNDGASSHTFTENSSFTFEFVDAAGNTGTAEATVGNIDRTPPTADIEYSTTNLTNQDVTVKLVNPSKDITVTNNNGSKIYTFVKNNSFTFEFIDAAGNTGTATATVGNIDKEAPAATITYSTEDLTNENVVAVLNPTEQVTVTNNDGLLSHTFLVNDSFTFTFVDAAGNSGTATATVNNIDKELPTVEIEYSTTGLTNQDVIVSLVNPSENIFVTNNNGLLSHTFTENGSFTFEFKDAAGNINTAEAKVNNIDKKPPTATIKYSTEELTNQDVTATITPNEAVTILNNGDSLSYTFTENGSFTFEFVDMAGNIGRVTATVSNIDKEDPTAVVSYSTEELTNQNVIATITPSEAVTITNNGGSYSYTFETNGSFTFEFKDAAGNIGEATATVENIDKVKPTADVEYSPKVLTNKNVVAKLVDESEPITVTNNDGLRSYTFENNGSFTFEFVDRAGNIGAATAIVGNIDRYPPTAEVKYSTTKLTNQDVIVELVNESEDITVTNNNGSKTYTFEENGTFTFEFEDTAGNTGTATAIVNNIDKEVPTATVSFSEEDPTNQNVVAVIHPSEAVIVTNNNGEVSYTFEKNGSFTFEFVDLAGNKGTATATVGNIDKDAPTATVTYSKEGPTNQDVAVKLHPSEDVTVTNNGGSLSYTFTTNGNFTFEFKDAAGNIGTAEATVSNIDKVPPTATVTYSSEDFTNQDIIATITTSKQVNITNNEGSFSHTFTANGSFTFEFVDAAGNKGTTTATVSNIDKQDPNLNITSPMNKTYYLNETVRADWTASDDHSGIISEVGKVDNDNGTILKGQIINTSNPGTHTFTVTVKDFAGNTTTKTVEYKVIYKSSGILQPINSNKSSLFKLGSTVPVKFQLIDGNSRYVTNATATIKIAKVNDSTVGDYQEVASTSAATIGNYFRYDNTDNQYIFNMSTKGLTTGTFSILVEIKQGLEVIQTETATISLK